VWETSLVLLTKVPTKLQNEVTNKVTNKETQTTKTIPCKIGLTRAGTG